ncbi:deoxyguanosinetriphosphate triphosphohydrolase [Schaalia sp. ZJ405]|uniref:deoxyguanosinetriphosphate triphosphohydrolase n=1 Tax=Schaalia sp. ZJ405 TaxID=2709403 RepID=UPI0013ED9718|nr:deoxyguanosinetriphosphate triphosphohydrolase [Schaalia sp. ZJ405]QPK82182.1 deoxyguanosinetriphosphate triphosphohydrolase [Schaalia sp. ZJ405]
MDPYGGADLLSGAYGPQDRQRMVQEKPKSSERTDFERDRARVLHSSALRRMGEKTQVLGPSTNDFVRTRLTHSLEVAQVGRELGKELGADPDVVDAACLSHDLGHPPFGHNGEKALDVLAGDIGGFEGNAQTLRIVARLEPKVLSSGGQPAGLNLTRATLDAICKYPWAKGQGPDPEKSRRKFSVYGDDEPVFRWMRQGAPEGRRCLEAQIMDLSDDIAYSVHDVEDAIATGKFAPADLHDDGVVEAVIDATVDWYGKGISRHDLEGAIQRLVSLDVWLPSFAGSYADLARLKDLTSELIGRFCSDTVAVTREAFGEGPLGRYRADLIVTDETRAEIQVLKGMAVHYVMSPRESEPVYYQQRTLLNDLVDVLFTNGPHHLEPLFAQQWRAAIGDEERLRVVIDQVSSLTDASASAWHARLCGMLSTQL